MSTTQYIGFNETLCVCVFFFLEKGRLENRDIFFLRLLLQVLLFALSRQVTFLILERYVALKSAVWVLKMFGFSMHVLRGFVGLAECPSA